MKYEAPELIVLTPAIDAIQTGKPDTGNFDGPNSDQVAAYEDWE